MRRLTYALVALVVASVSLMAGCSSAESGDPDESGINCHENADCGGERQCQSGFCSTSFDQEELELDFRFIAPSSSDYLNQTIEGVSLRQSERIYFGLKHAITVSGDDGDDGGIRYADDSPGAPSGTLVFQPEGLDEALFVREAMVDEGQFSARITPGRYAMTFVPNERSIYPKTSWPGERFEQNTALDLTVPGQYVEVAGTLERDAVAANGEVVEQESIAGAHVYATTRDGRHTSSIATTDQRGDFELAVAPDSGRFDIHVVPGDASAPIPSRRFDGVFEVDGGECETASGVVDTSCQLSTLSLGAYPSSPVDVPIALESSERSDGVDWSGTKVIVEGPLGEGDYRGEFPVADDGEARLELFPSMEAPDRLEQDYTIEIIPPVNSPLARTRHNLAEAVDLDRVTRFTVDTKREIHGDLRTHDGRGMGNARIELRQSGSNVADDRSLTTTTDGHGRFSVWLAEADYDIEVVPPDSSGQPRLLSTIDAEQIANEERLEPTLAAPSVILGAVVGTDQNADDASGIEGVTVEAYGTVDGRTVVYGQGRTDDRGHFRMALPSDLSL